jgi:hypothetical protein
VPLEDEPEASVEGVCESDELLPDDELLELELDEPEEDDEPLGCDVLVVFVRGSTYCWSPADVLVPDASTPVAANSEPAPRPAKQASVRTSRRTRGIEPGAAGRRLAPRLSGRDGAGAWSEP